LSDTSGVELVEIYENENAAYRLINLSSRVVVDSESEDVAVVEIYELT
jgi:hypothetical protein